ncbi:MAG: protein kinase, partial [Planctomycetales bacterium]|nr:protein kinase [Planctomycetales bacterium]
MPELPSHCCEACGRPLPDGSLSGCTFCLLELGLDSSASGYRASGELDAAASGIDDDVLTEFGDYELLSEIARGGMGVVYRARQKSLNRLVAVKLILAGQLATKESLQRFRREAEAAAKLHHPGIVPIYEIGEYETQHFFSMELIDGSSLAQCAGDFAVNGHASLPAQRDQQQCVADLMSRVAHALDFAHQHGVLHRDLKPSNILIDEAGSPHLTDFGLAKLTGREASGLTLSHAVLGTPGYLAPEQAGGDLDVTTLADVYGLGATMYELLVGQPPFVGTSALDTMMQAIERDPKPPRQLNPAIDADLETIVLRCLEKPPEKRYPSAAAVGEELDRYLRREPILARPIGQWERTRRWCQRHPGVTLMAGVALMTTLVGLGATWSQWYRATQANVRLQENVEHLQWDLIDDMLQDDEAAGALARIAALVRQNPRDWKAAMLGMSVLEQYRLPLPAIPPLRHPDGAELSVARLSPDGSAIVTASVDGTARLWNSATGGLMLPPLPHEGAVTWAEFSPDGRLLATCADDNMMRLWDVASGKLLREPLLQNQRVERVHFSPDGKQLLMRSADSVSVLDVARGELVWGPLDHQGRVVAARFVGDGGCVFTAQQAGQDSLVRVWDLPAGKASLRLATGPLRDADISADMSRVVTVSGEQGAVWDAIAGEKLHEFHSTSGHMVQVRLNAAGDKFAVVGWDHWVRVLHTESATPLTPELPHSYLVNGCVFVDSGDRLATWADDASVCLWDTTNGALDCEPMRHPNRVRFAEAGRSGGREVILATTSHLPFGSKSIGAGTGAAQLWHVHPKLAPDDRSKEHVYCYE